VGEKGREDKPLKEDLENFELAQRGMKTLYRMPINLISSRYTNRSAS
jgi:hypothetical protein